MATKALNWLLKSDFEIPYVETYIYDIKHVKYANVD